MRKNIKITYKDTVFDVQNQSDGLKINGSNPSLHQITTIQKGVFIVNIEGINYEVFVLEQSPNSKYLKLKVNQSIIELSITDTFDELLSKMGMQFKTETKITDLKAPMPGLVTDICVFVGQKVVKGDVLLKLEAMKMENNIKAIGESVIAKIVIEKGQTVEKNQALILFE